MSEIEILNKVEKEIEARNISDEQISSVISTFPHFLKRRIVGGYASVSIVDREGQRISINALKDAVKHFMEDSHYRAVNVFHSDVTVGRILPKWTNPDTGETFTTHVDDKGWWVVVEVRDDVEISDKVWAEIEKGNLRSFSIAGSSKAKKEMYESGKSWEEVMRLEIYEATICLPKGSKVWTKRGLVPIEEISTEDKVLTHKSSKRKPSWKSVTKTMDRNIDENIIKVTTDEGAISATKEHPIRVLAYEGRHKGTHYSWKSIKEIKVGDLISYHKSSVMTNRVKEFCGNTLSKVLKVEEVHYAGTVYNLEVEDDNSYSTEFAIMHNCELPGNQLSIFDVLYNQNKVKY